MGATLADFLLARIAEDEATVVAILRQNPCWEADGAEVCDSADRILAHVRGDYAAEHIARWDPARVLAECEAKRHVVDAYRGLWEVAKVTARAGRDEEANVARNMYAGVELAMQALALPYADHPDYREEWRP